MKEHDRDRPSRQQQEFEAAASHVRSRWGKIAGAGVLGLLLGGTRRVAARRGRFRRPKLIFLAIGLTVVALSVVTCSAGVDLADLTAEYGEPTQATVGAAQQFAQRAAAAVQRATASRSFRLTISEAEATSALSLGLMIPELMQVMETIPPDELRQAGDIESLRNRIRERVDAQRAKPVTLGERLAAMIDPHLRTGDVLVKFTESGEVVVAGAIHAWRWRQPALIVVAPRATGGKLELDFVKGRLGRLPAPAAAFDLLGELASSLILMGRDFAEISDLHVEKERLSFQVSVTR